MSNSLYGCRDKDAVWILSRQSSMFRFLLRFATFRFMFLRVVRTFIYRAFEREFLDSHAMYALNALASRTFRDSAL